MPVCHTTEACGATLQLDGLKKPVTIYADLDAGALDALLQRLDEVRMQMLPAPKRN